jgi:hypothetical protein
LTPNLQLGEARALFDRFSPAQQESARRFLARWTSFVRQNFDLYSNTRVLSGMPKLGQVEIYAHAAEDRSVVFLVNPDPFPSEASFPLDNSIGLSDTGPFLIHELYPEDRLLNGAANLTADKSEHLAANVPSHSVRVLEIARKPRYSKMPLRITGAPARYDRFADHYRITLDGNQGDSRTIRLYLPDGEKLRRVESSGQALPTQRVPGGYSLAVLFPKEKVDEQVQDWFIRSATLERGTAERIWRVTPDAAPVRLPQLASSAPVANFLGSRIENLLNERYSRQLLVYFERGKINEFNAEGAAPVQAAPAAQNLQSAGNSWWYTARFPVAYVQRFIPPAPNDHNYISLNFAKPGEVSVIKAWLNGNEVPVETFQYWRGPAWAKNYYIDGTKYGLRRGENTMTLFVNYENSAP